MILSYCQHFRKSEFFGRSGTKRHKKPGSGSRGAFRATIARYVHVVLNTTYKRIVNPFEILVYNTLLLFCKIGLHNFTFF